MRRILGLSLAALLYVTGVYGQSVAGSGAVTGTIRDTTGDGLPDTTVVVYNPALGVRRTIITTDDGVFDAPALPPAGGYHIKVTRKGFSNWESTDFDVSAGQTLNFRVDMQTE